MIKHYKVILGIVITCIALTGCIQKKNNDFETSNNKDSSIIYDIGSLPQSLININPKGKKDNEVLKALFMGIVYEDPNTMEVEPGLADKWDISKDKTEYTFHIRSGAKWSDGKLITAEDFYNFFKKVLSPKYKKNYAYELRFIYGVQSYNEGKCSFDDVAISAIDDNTLRIRLNNPCEYFLNILSMPIFSLRQTADYMNDWKKDYRRIKYTGPFKITFVKEDSLKLKKNDNYFLKDHTGADEIELKYYSSSNDISAYSITDYDANAADIFSSPPISEVSRLKESKDITTFNTWNVNGIYFNVKNSAVSGSLDFRKAISLSVDRESIASEIPKGIVSPAYNFMEKKFIGNYPKDNVFSKLNYAEALSELNKSGYSSNNKVVLVYAEDSLDEKLCELITQNINKNIKSEDDSKSINFEIKGYSKADLDKILREGDYDMYVGTYSMSYDNPMSFLEMWNSSSPYNFSGYSSLNYDGLMYNLNISENSEKRNEYYYKLLDELYADMPMIPLYFKNDIVCKKAFIKSIDEDKYGNIIIGSIK